MSDEYEGMDVEELIQVNPEVDFEELGAMTVQTVNGGEISLPKQFLELILNEFDAGATKVFVDIAKKKRGETSRSVYISGNGKGLEADRLQRFFSRHKKKDVAGETGRNGSGTNAPVINGQYLEVYSCTRELGFEHVLYFKYDLKKLVQIYRGNLQNPVARIKRDSIKDEKVKAALPETGTCVVIRNITIQIQPRSIKKSLAAMLGPRFIRRGQVFINKEELEDPVTTYPPFQILGEHPILGKVSLWLYVHGMAKRTAPAVYGHIKQHDNLFKLLHKCDLMHGSNLEESILPDLATGDVAGFMQFSNFNHFRADDSSISETTSFMLNGEHIDILRFLSEVVAYINSPETSLPLLNKLKLARKRFSSGAETQIVKRIIDACDHTWGPAKEPGGEKTERSHYVTPVMCEHVADGTSVVFTSIGHHPYDELEFSAHEVDKEGNESPSELPLQVDGPKATLGLPRRLRTGEEFRTIRVRCKDQHGSEKYGTITVKDTVELKIFPSYQVLFQEEEKEFYVPKYDQHPRKEFLRWRLCGAPLGCFITEQEGRFTKVVAPPVPFPNKATIELYDMETNQIIDTAQFSVKEPNVEDFEQLIKIEDQVYDITTPSQDHDRISWIAKVGMKTTRGPKRMALNLKHGLVVNAQEVETKTLYVSQAMIAAHVEHRELRNPLQKMQELLEELQLSRNTN